MLFLIVSFFFVLYYQVSPFLYHIYFLVVRLFTFLQLPQFTSMKWGFLFQKQSQKTDLDFGRLFRNARWIQECLSCFGMQDVLGLFWNAR